jgi:hypothetical protein
MEVESFLVNSLDPLDGYVANDRNTVSTTFKFLILNEDLQRIHEIEHLERDKRLQPKHCMFFFAFMS